MNYKWKVLLSYLVISTLVGIFSYVYLSFVPGVFNLWMVGAFSIPLFAGILEVAIKQTTNKPNHIQRGLFRLAIATMTVQVILKGIYEIALTNLRGEFMYVIAWMLLILASLSAKE
jgi:hypothetical protein